MLASANFVISFGGPVPRKEQDRQKTTPSAFVKLVFGSDASLDGIEGVLAQYRALFEACDVPSRTQSRILVGTLAKILSLPE
jgi:hypothetical protein